MHHSASNHNSWQVHSGSGQQQTQLPNGSVWCKTHFIGTEPPASTSKQNVLSSPLIMPMLCKTMSLPIPALLCAWVVWLVVPDTIVVRVVLLQCIWPRLMRNLHSSRHNMALHLVESPAFKEGDSTRLSGMWPLAVHQWLPSALQSLLPSGPHSTTHYYQSHCGLVLPINRIDGQAAA